MKNVVAKGMMMLALALAAGCGGTETKRDPVPAPGAAPATSALEARFEAAYFRLGCMANPGKDPESSLSPLRKPADYLNSLVANKDPKLAKALEVLNANGFPTVSDFQQVELRLHGRVAYWQTVDARFIDELKKCR